MSNGVFIAAPEGESGKSSVALGLADLLIARVGKVGVFRPVTESEHSVDLLVELLLSLPGVEQSYADALGVSYEAVHDDPAAAMSEIVSRFRALSSRFDVVIVLGSDYTDVSTPNDLAFDGRVAANLGVPVLLVVHGHGRTPAQIRIVIDSSRTELAAAHIHPITVIANRVEPDDLDRVRAAMRTGSDAPVWVIPEVPVLVAPTVRALQQACGGTLIGGNPALLDRECLGFVIAAMSMPNVLTRLDKDYTVIAPGDRYDLLPGLAMAHLSDTFPRLSAIVLTGGYTPPEPVTRLIDGFRQDLPIIVSNLGTFESASSLAAVRGRLTAGSTVKIETALRVFAGTVDAEALLAAIDFAASDVITPLMFQFQLIERARAGHKHIVLPEGEDLRILAATAHLLRLGVAELTLLGDEDTILAKASMAGLDISGAKILSPKDPQLIERFAAAYTQIRAKKEMTLERARDIVSDVSYFGTMMVYEKMADGMVSGAAHTTAHTIKPSFEIIKTAPGTAIVSSVFLMCLSDRVLVYGDCAVNPNPTAEQLADIAISSATTATRFGIEPRVAMLSYSTGSSGAGADVEGVRAATEIVRARRPDLLIEGPIQYDAAVDPGVAASKAPHSEVAGRATVLIFPDLNTGNNTYKAVQRSADAVAIGPVLQGLNKPVNDLSRGALVADIINTVAITAVQASEADSEQSASGPAGSKTTARRSSAAGGDPAELAANGVGR